MEHNNGIAFVKEVLKIIHEASEFEVQQLGIIGNPGDTWLWSCDFMRPSQWSQDTAADVTWTDVDYISVFLTAASLPREEPLMHTQKDFNPFVIKVAPEGSL